MVGSGWIARWDGAIRLPGPDGSSSAGEPATPRNARARFSGAGGPAAPPGGVRCVSEGSPSWRSSCLPPDAAPCSGQGTAPLHAGQRPPVRRSRVRMRGPRAGTRRRSSNARRCRARGASAVPAPSGHRAPSRASEAAVSGSTGRTRISWDSRESPELRAVRRRDRWTRVGRHASAVAENERANPDATLPPNGGREVALRAAPCRRRGGPTAGDPDTWSSRPGAAGERSCWYVGRHSACRKDRPDGTSPMGGRGGPLRGRDWAPMPPSSPHSRRSLPRHTRDPRRGALHPPHR